MASPIYLAQAFFMACMRRRAGFLFYLLLTSLKNTHTHTHTPTQHTHTQQKQAFGLFCFSVRCCVGVGLTCQQPSLPPPSGKDSLFPTMCLHLICVYVRFFRPACLCIPCSAYHVFFFMPRLISFAAALCPRCACYFLSHHVIFLYACIPTCTWFYNMYAILVPSCALCLLDFFLFFSCLHYSSMCAFPFCTSSHDLLLPCMVPSQPVCYAFMCVWTCMPCAVPFCMYVHSVPMPIIPAPSVVCVTWLYNTCMACHLPYGLVYCLYFGGGMPSISHFLPFSCPLGFARCPMLYILYLWHEHCRSHPKHCIFFIAIALATFLYAFLPLWYFMHYAPLLPCMSLLYTTFTCGVYHGSFCIVTNNLLLPS